MCYSCRNNCEQCKPKFIYCPDCGEKSSLSSAKCKNCQRLFSETDKKAAMKAWLDERERRLKKAFNLDSKNI